MTREQILVSISEWENRYLKKMRHNGFLLSMIFPTNMASFSKSYSSIPTKSHHWKSCLCFHFDKFNVILGRLMLKRFVRHIPHKHTCKLAPANTCSMKALAHHNAGTQRGQNYDDNKHADLDKLHVCCLRCFVTKFMRVANMRVMNHMQPSRNTWNKGSTDIAKRHSFISELYFIFPTCRQIWLECSGRPPSKDYCSVRVFQGFGMLSVGIPLPNHMPHLGRLII